MWTRSVVLVLGAALIGCAPQAGTATRTRNTNVLTAEEIAASQTPTAYDAIRKLRPTFLRTRGPNNFEPGGGVQTAHVFLDGQRYGDIEALKTMPVSTIREIRYLSASDATTKYGTGYMNGVIEVYTR